MTNIRFLYDNDFIPGATISSSSEATDFADDSTALDWRAVKWRSTGDSDEHVKIRLGSSLARTALVVDGHNLTSGSTVTLRSSTDNFGAVDDLVGTLDYEDPDDGPMLLFFTDTASDWKVRFQNAANPDAYIEVSRLFMGTYFEPTINYDFGWAEKKRDYSSIVVNPKGVKASVVRPQARSREFTAQIHTAAQFFLWKDMLQTVGTHTPFFVVMDFDNEPARDTVFCRFEDVPVLGNNFLNEFTTRFTLIEEV